jgi:hypothetical protein
MVEKPEKENNNQAIAISEDDDLYLEEDNDDDFFLFPPIPEEKQKKYIYILKNILPHLGSDETKIILTEIMIALKLEGILGKQLSMGESNMVNVIKDSIMEEPIRKHQALKFAQKLLE